MNWCSTISLEPCLTVGANPKGSDVVWLWSAYIRADLSKIGPPLCPRSPAEDVSTNLTCERAPSPTGTVREQLAVDVLLGTGCVSSVGAVSHADAVCTNSLTDTSLCMVCRIVYRFVYRSTHSHTSNTRMPL